MFGLGIGEAAILLIVVLLFFGGKKLPELGNSMGKAITNFKKGMKETNEGDSSANANLENKSEKES